MNNDNFAKIVFTIIWAALIYLLACIIAYDFNPKNWWAIGRIAYLVIIAYIVGHYFLGEFKKRK